MPKKKSQNVKKCASQPNLNDPDPTLCHLPSPAAGGKPCICRKIDRSLCPFKRPPARKTRYSCRSPHTYRSPSSSYREGSNRSKRKSLISLPVSTPDSSFSPLSESLSVQHKRQPNSSSPERCRKCPKRGCRCGAKPEIVNQCRITQETARGQRPERTFSVSEGQSPLLVEPVPSFVETKKKGKCEVCPGVGCDCGVIQVRKEYIAKEIRRILDELKCTCNEPCTCAIEGLRASTKNIVAGTADRNKLPSYVSSDHESYPRSSLSAEDSAKTIHSSTSIHEPHSYVSTSCSIKAESRTTDRKPSCSISQKSLRKMTESSSPAEGQDNAADKISRDRSRAAVDREVSIKNIERSQVPTQTEEEKAFHALEAAHHAHSEHEFPIKEPIKFPSEAPAKNEASIRLSGDESLKSFSGHRISIDSRKSATSISSMSKMSAALRKSQAASHPENKVNFIQPSFNEEELSLQIPEDALRKSEAFRHSKSMVISDQNLPEHMDTVSRQSRHSAGSTVDRICHLPSPEYASETPASPKYPLTIVSGSTIELPKMRSTGVGSSEVLAESVLTQTESFSSFSEKKDVPFEMKKHGRIESLKQPRESGESRRTLNEAYRTNERKGSKCARKCSNTSSVRGFAHPSLHPRESMRLSQEKEASLHKMQAELRSGKKMSVLDPYRARSSSRMDEEPDLRTVSKISMERSEPIRTKSESPKLSRLSKSRGKEDDSLADDSSISRYSRYSSSFTSENISNLPSFKTHKNSTSISDLRRKSDRARMKRPSRSSRSSSRSPQNFRSLGVGSSEAMTECVLTQTDGVSSTTDSLKRDTTFDREKSRQELTRTDEGIKPSYAVESVVEIHPIEKRLSGNVRSEFHSGSEDLSRHEDELSSDNLSDSHLTKEPKRKSEHPKTLPSKSASTLGREASEKSSIQRIDISSKSDTSLTSASSSKKSKPRESRKEDRLKSSASDPESSHSSLKRSSMQKEGQPKSSSSRSVRDVDETSYASSSDSSSSQERQNFPHAYLSESCRPCHCCKACLCANKKSESEAGKSDIEPIVNRGDGQQISTQKLLGKSMNKPTPQRSPPPKAARANAPLSPIPSRSESRVNSSSRSSKSDYGSRRNSPSRSRSQSPPRKVRTNDSPCGRPDFPTWHRMPSAKDDQNLKTSCRRQSRSRQSRNENQGKSSPSDRDSRHSSSRQSSPRSKPKDNLEDLRQSKGGSSKSTNRDVDETCYESSSNSSRSKEVDSKEEVDSPRTYQRREDRSPMRSTEVEDLGIVSSERVDSTACSSEGMVCRIVKPETKCQPSEKIKREPSSKTSEQFAESNKEPSSQSIGVQCDTPRKPTALPDSNDGLDEPKSETRTIPRASTATKQSDQGSEQSLPVREPWLSSAREIRRSSEYREMREKEDHSRLQVGSREIPKNRRSETTQTSKPRERKKSCSFTARKSEIVECWVNKKPELPGSVCREIRCSDRPSFCSSSHSMRMPHRRMTRDSSNCSAGPICRTITTTEYWSDGALTSCTDHFSHTDAGRNRSCDEMSHHDECFGRNSSCDEISTSSDDECCEHEMSKMVSCDPSRRRSSKRSSHGCCYPAKEDDFKQQSEDSISPKTVTIAKRKSSIENLSLVTMPPYEDELSSISLPRTPRDIFDDLEDDHVPTKLERSFSAQDDANRKFSVVERSDDLKIGEWLTGIKCHQSMQRTDSPAETRRSPSGSSYPSPLPPPPSNFDMEKNGKITNIHTKKYDCGCQEIVREYTTTYDGTCGKEACPCGCCGPKPPDPCEPAKFPPRSPKMQPGGNDCICDEPAVIHCPDEKPCDCKFPCDCPQEWLKRDPASKRPPGATGGKSGSPPPIQVRPFHCPDEKPCDCKFDCDCATAWKPPVCQPEKRGLCPGERECDCRSPCLAAAPPLEACGCIAWDLEHKETQTAGMQAPSETTTYTETCPEGSGDAKTDCRLYPYGYRRQDDTSALSTDTTQTTITVIETTDESCAEPGCCKKFWCCLYCRSKDKKKTSKKSKQVKIKSKKPKKPKKKKVKKPKAKKKRKRNDE